MTRADMPSDPAKTVRALRACREAMIEVQRWVRPMGPGHHGAAMVIAAIDGFATFLTGERYYFSQLSSGATEGERKVAEERKAQESGKKPWPPVTYFVTDSRQMDESRWFYQKPT